MATVMPFKALGLGCVAPSVPHVVLTMCSAVGDRPVFPWEQRGRPVEGGRHSFRHRE